MLYYDGLVKALNFCIILMLSFFVMNIGSKDYKRKTVIWAILTILFMFLVIVEITNGTPKLIDFISLIIFLIATVSGTLLVRAEEREAEEKHTERLIKDYKIVSIVLDEFSITDASEDVGKKQ